MKIAHKLVSLVALAGLAIIILTVVSYFKLQDVKTHSADVSDNVLPSVLLLSDAQLELSGARIHSLNQMLQADETEKKVRADNFNQSIEKTLEALKKYESYIVDELDRKNIDTFKNELSAYATITREVMALSQAQKQEEAIELSRGKAAPQAQKVLSAATEAVKLNQQYVEESRKEINNAITSAVSLSLTFGLLLFAVICIIGVMIGRSIVNPLNGMRQFVVQLGTDYDFTRRMTVTHHDEIGESLEAINGLINTLQTSLQQLNRIGRDVTGTASGLSNASQQLSSASHNVSNAASSMAAGVEEVTVSISHMADSADECDRTAREAGQMASTGGTVIESTITSINQIAEDVRVSAQQIESLKDRTASINAVVNVIKDIADQTNLLALNAAIEAARAGDLGRGFAVVADEVRKLAERTASSTQEIIGTVSAIQNEANITVTTMQQTVRQVDLGVERAQEASDAISKIRQNADQVVIQVSEITSTMREQSAASAMMAQQVEQVAQISEESSSVAQSTAGEGERLRQLSQELDSAISRYRV